MRTGESSSVPAERDVVAVAVDCQMIVWPAERARKATKSASFKCERPTK